MSDRRLLVDACVLINLLATGRMAEIIAANSFNAVIVREVAMEAFYLRANERVPERHPVDLIALCEARLMDVIDLAADELDHFVSCATYVDEGEAATLAAAIHRGMPLATDDRGALRLISREYPNVERYRTSDLLRGWARSASSSAEVASALRSIELRANFVPGPRDPGHAWWLDSRQSKVRSR